MERVKQKVFAILFNNKTEFCVSSFQARLFDLLCKRDEGRNVINVLLDSEYYISSEVADIRNLLPNVIQLLVNKVENCSFYDETKKTILHHASLKGWLEVVQTLLKEGADTNAGDINGFTPLFMAINNSHKDVVALLIDSGANVNSYVSEQKCTPLHFAVCINCIEIVQYLLKNGANPNASTEITGMTPLHLAVLKSHIDIIGLLIDSGADINAVSPTLMWRSLHCAATIGNLELVKFLVEKGADLNVKCIRGLSPLYMACAKKNIEVILYLVKASNIKYCRNDTPLNFITQNYPSLQLIRLLIERGAYLMFIDYCSLLRIPILKEGILQNAQNCTQAVINRFNNKVLTDLYKLPMTADKLPPLEQMIIRSQGMIQDVEQSVQKEIETNGHCDVMKPRIIVLRILAVQSYIDYYDGLRKKSQLKRSVIVDFDEQSQSSSKMQRFN